METIIEKFRALHASKKKISVVTCYDYSFARILSKTNIDAILVGDSLGMVIQGHKDTIPVTLDDMIYHSRAVKRGAPNVPIIADMPFMSYQTGFKEGIANACKLFKETGVDAIKLEGADIQTTDQIQRLTEIGIPVVGHVGLTPQSYQVLGGYKVQKNEADIFNDAIRLAQHGAFAIVLEMTPEKVGYDLQSKTIQYVQKRSELLASISSNPDIKRYIQTPVITIGIGAGRYTSGQVLVLNDLLGMNSEFHPKFLKKYANLEETIKEAINSYDKDVKERNFPALENVFSPYDKV